MLPYIHVGPLTLGTYGIFVAMGLLVAAFVLSKDLRRRALDADPNVIVGYTGIAGLIGSRLYSCLETPSEFFANPWPLLFSRTGFTWIGGLLGGFITLVLLARHYRMPLLRMLDIASPAAAIGYGVGRIGCLISGDGDYGTPTLLPWGMSFPNGIVPTTQRVHPTPIYEFIGALVIFWLLWRLGARTMGDDRAIGKVFALYLILTGVIRFLIEFIRLNPRVLFGMTNAQLASIISVLFGAFLLLRLRR
ncbi:MAG TPA: prolipoprotein diacylglyceryl transferase [Candidatus Acidoferrum sp.]|nr:prolipoprotein diacylglyceryl transferase [Candidatus Acidoferrum sp.]